MAHIALLRAVRGLMLMAALDSHALQKWIDVHVEFLIHVAPESAGLLIRIIKCLAQADSLGSSPGLTNEPPSHVDPRPLRLFRVTKWPSRNVQQTSARRRSIHTK
ncbi:hypothetical protein BDW66DRAFT_137515 [Aspergillus desertorum]